jgi:hypothetical protein
MTDEMLLSIAQSMQMFSYKIISLERVMKKANPDLYKEYQTTFEAVKIEHSEDIENLNKALIELKKPQ